MKSFWNVGKELLSGNILSGKMLLILAYLRVFASYTNEVRISIIWLVENIGYKPKSGYGNTTEQVREIVQLLKKRGAIDFEDPKSTTAQIKIRLNMDHPYFSPQSAYVQIANDELEKITGCTYKHKDWLIAVFLIIKQHMFYDTQNESYGVACPSIATIQKEVSEIESISRNSVIKVLQLLVDEGLLNMCSIGDYAIEEKGKETLRTFPNFYTVGGNDINTAECENLAREQLRIRGVEIDRFIPHVTEHEKEYAIDHADEYVTEVSADDHVPDDYVIDDPADALEKFLHFFDRKRDELSNTSEEEEYILSWDGDEPSLKRRGSKGSWEPSVYVESEKLPRNEDKIKLPWED